MWVNPIAILPKKILEITCFRKITESVRSRNIMLNLLIVSFVVIAYTTECVTELQEGGSDKDFDGENLDI